MPDYNLQNDTSKYVSDSKGNVYASADVAKQQGVTDFTSKSARIDTVAAIANANKKSPTLNPQPVNPPAPAPNTAVAPPAPIAPMAPEDLAPAAVTPWAKTPVNPVPDVSKLYETPPLEMTKGETEAQGLTDRLMELNKKLQGKSAFQNEQENKFGVDNAAATINDLGSQLQELKNEAAAIPLQLQQGAADRGVTLPQLGRQENSRLRTNAIAALGVSSLMSAAQGQLATAQMLADRAVSAKYEPISEEILALSSNLNLILSSPSYSIEQKNRAQKQLDIQRERQAKLDEIKENETSIKTIALEAAAAGADSVTLKKIQEAKTPIEATQHAATYIKTRDNVQAALESGITTELVNKGGEWFSTTKQKTYGTPEELFKDYPQLQGSFARAYELGLASDFTADRVENREFAIQARAKYPDAGILPTDSPEAVGQKIQGSALFQKDIYIAPDSDNSDPFSGIMGEDTDNRVKQIIKQNPGEYGKAAAQIESEFGQGTATTYDSWLRRVYNYGQNIDDITSGKAPTEGNYQSAGYANRLSESNTNIEKLVGNIKGMSKAEWEIQSRLPESTRSSQFKEYDQAVKNFITAKLRKESGASISPSEFEDAYKVYIPKPGDSDQILQQKAQARAGAFRDMAASGGNAFNIPPSSGGSGNGMIKMRAPDGGEWEVPPDAIQEFKNNGYTQISFNKAGNASASSNIVRAVATKYPQNSNGGQCITFLHKVANFPSIGDGKLEKFASVDKFGIKKANWQPQVGDIVITGENKTYGHGYMINQLLGNGKARVTESNFGLNGKVTHTRIVNLNAPTVYGAIRPQKLNVRTA